MDDLYLEGLLDPNDLTEFEFDFGDAFAFDFDIPDFDFLGPPGTQRTGDEQVKK